MAAWQQQNPLAKYDKTRSWVNTDGYIDMAIRAIIETDKILFEPGKTLEQAWTMKIVNVDQLENIMIGLGKVARGKDAEGKLFPYQVQLDKAREALDVEIFENALQKNVKWAILRFQILLSAIHKSKPMNVEFSG